MRHSSLWGTYGWLSPHFANAPGDLKAFFVFIEDASELENAQSVEAPDASTFAPDHFVFKNKPFRFRTSGVEVTDFLKREEAFDSLVRGQISADQRNLRLEQLREFFDSVAVPVIDIYASERDEEFRAMRMALLPGTWHIAVISYGSEQTVPYPVFSSRGAARIEDGFDGGALVELAAVPPPVEVRLRDIFSLNHVGDSDLNPDEGSDRAPMDPGDPGPGRPADRTDPEVQPVYEYQHQYQRAWEEEEQQAQAVVHQPQHPHKQQQSRPSPAKKTLTQSH